MVSEEHRDLLKQRLLFWDGVLPPDIDVGDANSFVKWVISTGAGTVIVDSYKDFGLELSSESGGTTVNTLMQTTLSEGIEWVGLHHHRKANSENKKPKMLQDVYGSNWITAGKGSVLLHWAPTATATAIEVSQLKAPAEPLDAFMVTLDRERGTLTSQIDPVMSALSHLGIAGAEGVTEDVLATYVFGDDSRAAKARLSRALTGVPRVERIPGSRGGSTKISPTWRLTTP